MPNLRRINSYWRWPNAFVKMSASCSLDGTKMGWICPATISSRTQWQSISMCFVRSWNTGFWDMCKAAWMSQWRDIDCEWDTPRLERRLFNHVNSHVVSAIDRYSASADKRDTVCCFFVFQETGEPPRNTNQPVRERLVKGQPPQLASHLPCSWKSHLLLNWIPWLGLPFKYWTTRNAAS